MNWTPSNIFDARDAGMVTDRNGVTVTVKLYADGWAIGTIDKLDVWSACRRLNDLGATL